MSFRLQSALLRASFWLKFGGRLPPNPALPAFLNTLLTAADIGKPLSRPRRRVAATLY